MAVLSSYMVAAKHAALDREYDRTANARPLTCPVCEFIGRNASFFRNRSVCRFGGGRLERYYCPKCDALFGPSKMLDMTPAELGTEYAILYATYSEGDTSHDTARTFHSMKPERGPVYLDWGCGWWSQAITDMRLQGWNVWGYEPTPGGANDFVVSEIGHIAPGLAGIYSNNVIEHFTDPAAEFRKMRALLAPGGVMAHSTACYAERFLDTRFHTVFFLGESIRNLAERTGFEVVSREEDGDYMNTVFRAV
jgi:hypothetical protein